MTLDPESVGRRIREARLAKGWTHEELARQMKVNWRTVQRWQKGELPRLGTLMDLADLFGLPRSYFVETDDPQATLREIREQLDRLAKDVEEIRERLGLGEPATQRAVPR